VAARFWRPTVEQLALIFDWHKVAKWIFRLSVVIRSRNIRGTLLALLLCCSGLIAAEEPSGWLFDSLTFTPDGPKSDAQQVYEVLLKMLDLWNAHDIEGHLEAYWKSPQLLTVVDSEQFNGWQQLHDSYLNGYPDRNSMGFINPARIQVKLLKPDLALALTWWSISFSNSKQKVVGNSTINLEKFDDGWKIVASHSSTTEM